MVDQEWLDTCVQAGEFLYGIFPVDLLQRMYASKAGHQAATQELLEAVRNSDSILMHLEEGTLPDPSGTYRACRTYLAPTLISESENPELYAMMEEQEEQGNPYAGVHLRREDQQELLGQQAQVEFYLPTRQEISEIVSSGYIRTPEMTTLENLIRQRGGDPSLPEALWAKISTDAMDGSEAIMMIVQQAGTFKSLEEINAFTRKVTDFTNRINMRVRRGWQPEELAKRMKPSGPLQIVPGSSKMAEMLKEAAPELEQMGAKVRFNANAGHFVKMNAYGEEQVVKVYPNDPCPCGSGKKYKKCHGRNVTW